MKQIQVIVIEDSWFVYFKRPQISKINSGNKVIQFAYFLFKIVSASGPRNFYPNLLLLTSTNLNLMFWELKNTTSTYSKSTLAFQNFIVDIKSLSRNSFRWQLKSGQTFCGINSRYSYAINYKKEILIL